MFRIDQIISKGLTIAQSRQVRIAVMVLAVALFVFAAGAPNATGCIGK